jgi:hypothetical protein
VRVALVQPWGGQWNATCRPIVDVWVTNMAAQGLPVFDPRATSDSDGGTTLRLDWCAVNSGGAPVDRLHPNQVAHGELAKLAYEQAKKWQGWIAPR